jgi:hypothetical protein
MPTEPAEVVVRVATTPAAAKILVAMLRAEGIPAFTDGDSLADEVAVSRRLMNLSGVAVRVPADRAEAAREILAAARPDDADLEAQSLAADPAVAAAQSRAAPPRPPLPVGRIVAWAIGPALAILFLCLWLDERSQPRQDPLFDYEPTPDGWREIRRSTGRVARVFQDQNGDGVIDVIETYDGSGNVVSRAFDGDGDGWYERVVELHADGTRAVWADTDANETLDTVTLLDADGKEVLGQRWDWKAGFVPVR